MRYSFLIFFFTAIAFSLQGQDNTILEKGVVSYIASQNIYVKFKSTENIKVGDTLYIKNGNLSVPKLVVVNKSSISCICSSLSTKRISVSDEVFAQKSNTNNSVILPEKNLSNQQEDTSSIAHQPRFLEDKSTHKSNTNKNKQIEKETNYYPKQEGDNEFKQLIKGRVSIASYNNMSDSRNLNRMRYTFSLRGNNLGNSRLSLDSYITFRHTINEWEEVKDNLSSALRVYSLALRYDFNKSTNLTLGRKINPKISSMGAVDGIQFEKGMGKFVFGAILGSRPDYIDYGLNFNLFQYGAYISHESNTKNKFEQSTIAFIEQRNNSEIDRRFIYFQHSSSLVGNLNLFTSVEMSLYEKINNETNNSPSLTNLYVSLRYRLSRKLSFSASYDNRKNIIYYESYKSFIDRLIEDETRQGVRININYRPFKYVTWGINANWRFQKNDKNLSKNLNTYLTFSRIPALNIRTTITANFLQTNYLNSRIFGIRISKEIIPGKLSADINYRNVDYKYLNYETKTHQNIAGMNFSLKIANKLSLYMYYEGIFDNQNKIYNSLNAKIIRRF